MDEETVTRLSPRLEAYMTKSLSSKLCIKKQLHGLHIKERTVVLEHLNFFNKVISELLTVDVKIDEEDKTSILLSSLLQYIQSYRHYHVKETLILSRQLSYLMRSRKDQIKRSMKD